MSKFDEASKILKAMGMPRRQCNSNAVITLLASAGIGPTTLWSDAKQVRVSPHKIIAFINEKYSKTYAENTRESVRKNAIHQFVDGGILVRNPDDPGLATNSPRTHYAISDVAIKVVRRYGQPDFDAKVADFLKLVDGGLAARYAKPRKSKMISVSLSGGGSFELSPGKHNVLQRDIVQTFLPKFAPGAVLLYFGDTAKKTLILDKKRLSELAISITKHDKLPDVVALYEEKNWLFLIEAVATSGPVSPNRYSEFKNVLKNCPIGTIWVSAFLDFKTFKKYADDIAWETEVWIADAPGHLLHYNGDRFLGPR